MEDSKVILKVSDLTKEIEGRAGYTAHIFEAVNFSLQQGEFTSVLAQEKSGKSTLLKTIAGIYKPTSGKIEIQDKKGNSLKASFFAYIPSLASSYPWLSVKQNLEYFLLASGLTTENTEEAISEAITLVGLSGYEEHHPDNRSLGFRFRITLARALVTRPAVMLIDEPFNSLEEKTKEELYVLLREIFNKTQTTILLATSNMHEAIFLSDSVLVMDNHSERILSRVKVNLPAQRTMDLFNSKGFSEAADSVRNICRDRQIQLNSVLLS